MNRSEIEKWLEANRDNLPLNIDQWKLSTMPVSDDKIEAQLPHKHLFYKTISRFFKVHTDESTS